MPSRRRRARIFRRAHHRRGFGQRQLRLRTGPARRCDLLQGYCSRNPASRSPTSMFLARTPPDLEHPRSEIVRSTPRRARGSNSMSFIRSAARTRGPKDDPCCDQCRWTPRAIGSYTGAHLQQGPTRSKCERDSAVRTRPRAGDASAQAPAGRLVFEVEDQAGSGRTAALHWSSVARQLNPQGPRERQKSPVLSPRRRPCVSLLAPSRLRPSRSARHVFVWGSGGAVSNAPAGHRSWVCS